MSKGYPEAAEENQPKKPPKKQRTCQVYLLNGQEYRCEVSVSLRVIALVVS